MSEAYKIVFENGTDEIVEKKSRFIANVFAVETEEEVLEIIERRNIGMPDIIVMPMYWAKMLKNSVAVMTANRRERQEGRCLM